MSGDSPLHILAECDNGYIGVCECCCEYNFVYKNILLIFSQEELTRFCSWVLQNRFYESTYLPLAHGRTRVFTSSLSNLFIVFREDELDEVDQLFSQAKLVLEARHLLQQRTLKKIK
jgi:hypothetical protein